VQQWLLRKATTQASKALDTEVLAGKVIWNFPNNIILDDVEILDQSGDSLIYIEQLETKIRSIDLDNQFFKFGDVNLKRPIVKFNSQNGQAGMNYLFLTEIGQTAAGGQLARLWFKKIIIEDGVFEFRRDDLPEPSSRKFDETNLRFEKINAELLSMEIIGDSLNFKVKSMAAKDKSGLELKHLACKAKIHSNGMEFDEILMRTNESSIEHYIAFDYDGYPMMGDFIDSVYVRAELSNTVLSMRDLAYFSNTLEQYGDEKFKLSSSLKGTVTNFKLRDMLVELGDGGRLTGEAKIKGLPDWEVSYVDIDVDEFSSSISEMERLLKLDFPEEVKRFGNTQFKGHITGFYSNFAVDGNLRSNLGYVKSRIQIEELENGSRKYNGNIVSSSFNLGQMLNSEDLGNIALDLDLENVSGTNTSDLNGDFKANITSIEMAGHTIQNVDAKGQFNSGGFNGFTTIADPNLNLEFDGKIDFNGKYPKYNFKSKIKRLNLQSFGLDTIKSIVSGEFDVNLKGKSLDLINGLISARDVNLLRSGESFTLNNLFISSGYKNELRSIILRSDFADVNLKGNFKFSQLDQVYGDFLNALFPDYYVNERPVKDSIIITADARIRSNKLVNNLMPLGIELGNGSFKGNYLAKEKSLEVDGRMDEIVYQGFTFKNYFLNIRKEPFQLLNMATDIEEVLSNDSAFVHTVELNASILPNDVDFMLNVSDTSDLLALRTFGRLKFTNDSISLQLEESKLFSEGRRWTINNKNSFLFTDGNSLVQMLEISSLMCHHCKLNYLRVNWP